MHIKKHINNNNVAFSNKITIVAIINSSYLTEKWHTSATQLPSLKIVLKISMKPEKNSIRKLFKMLKF